MASTEDNIECARDMVLLDRKVPTDEVAHVLQISHGSGYEMMHNKLRFHKVCARWIPKQLSQVHKQTHVDICQKHLDYYGNERDIFLDRIITGDETWVHHYEQESNGRVWNRNIHNSPARKSSKPTICRKTDAYNVLGLTRPSTGTLSGEGHNNKLCVVQRDAY